MGKVKALLMEMEEDAEGMSAEEWMKKWGANYLTPNGLTLVTGWRIIRSSLEL